MSERVLLACLLAYIALALIASVALSMSYWTTEPPVSPLLFVIQNWELYLLGGASMILATFTAYRLRDIEKKVRKVRDE